MADRLVDFFSKSFTYDEQGLPRFWNDPTEVDFYFQKAKNVAMDQLEGLGKFQIPDWVSSSILNDSLGHANKFVFHSETSMTTMKKTLEKNL